MDRSFVAERVRRALERRGKTLWIDLEDIPPAATWREQVDRGITSATSFIFVLSPESVVSQVCAEELRRAVELNKRLVPILRRDVEPSTVPAELEQRNWILLRDGDPFDRGLDQLVDALEADLAWRDAHARLAVRAGEWINAERDSGSLLRGRELHDAEGWLASQHLHREAATSNQAEYIVASRRAATRRQRITLAAIATALLLAVGLAVVALVQRGVAVQRQRLAESRELASAALDQLPTDPQLSLRLAMEAVKRGNTAEAVAALRQALLQPAERVAIENVGDSGDLNIARFSPDGRAILTVSDEGGTRLWDARTGHELTALSEPHTFGPATAAFSPSGRLIATADLDNKVRVWSPSGLLMASPPVPTQDATSAITEVSDAPFSPSERLLITGGGHAASVWEIATGRRRALLRAHGPEVFGARFSGDARYAAASTSERDETSEVWDLDTGRSLAILAGIQPRFSPNGHRLITFTEDHVHLWTLHGRAIAVLPGTSYIAAFSRNGRRVLTGSSRGGEVFSARDGRRVAHPAGALHPVGEPAFSTDGRFVMPGPSDVLSVTTGERVAKLAGLNASLSGFAPDGSFLTTDDAGVHVWAAPHSDAVSVGSRRSRVVAVAGGRGSWTAAVAVGQSAARVWQGWLRAPRRPRPHAGPQLRGVAGITLSRDGRFAASVDRRGDVHVWTTAPWRQVARVATGASSSEPHSTLAPFPTPLGVSRDGHLVGILSDLAMSVWDTETRRRLNVHNEDDVGDPTISFSPDGRLVVPSDTAPTTLRESTTGRRVATLRPLKSQVHAAVFSGDGARVATASDDGAARVWDTESGKRLSVMRQPAGVTAAAFSADGRFLATTSWDRSVRVWEVSTGRRVAQLPMRAPIESAVAFSASQSTVIVGGAGVVQTIACEICRSTDGLMKLAEQRAHRTLSRQERRVFLHE